ncbi:alpha-tectorin-like [Toxotes jaculatrix]|uniref:alpha-tectorin-like n=1 Tax=Toxotes jaculatrix TaxID=941984 RepID=UPI001B3AFEBC|nr:alpha-tectorin-like [Toxotes jaculatrix]
MTISKHTERDPNRELCLPHRDEVDTLIQELKHPVKLFFRRKAASLPNKLLQKTGSMFRFILNLAALSMLAGTGATRQTFTSSGEMDITSCPITYYGQTYGKVYVAFNASRFSVCFNGEYKPGIKNDCIVMSGGTADRGNLAILTKEIPTGSGVHKLLPNLKSSGKCVNIIPLKDSQQSEIEQVELGNFGTQAILAIKTYSGYTHVDVEADAQVNGLTVSKQTFQTAETNKGVITDVSGCRLSGAVYKTNTTVRDPNICSTVTCDVNGVAHAVSDCGPMEQCEGMGSCVLSAMCTVIGPTVIDFVGRTHTVPDRCGYTLMRPSTIPGFQVLGVFRERRRKDVSFLDRVIVQLDREGVQISLEQGGRVQLNGKVLMLNTTTQVVQGVELSKDKTGVTAKISASNYTISVLFDGSITMIHMTGPNGAPVHGLCGNSSRTVPSEEKVSEHSETGCEVQYDDAADSTINCNATTEWCNLLKKAPFTACNKHIDPEPFITACTQTLCKYPAVDGLKCQFLEAYARACRHRTDVTVEGWRSKTSCCKADFCQDRFCSAHEFCGEKDNGGETRCLCRAIFASKYKSTSTFGEPTVCRQKAASVTLANCLLEDKGIDYSVLHLNDQACTGEMDNLTHMVTFSFNSTNPCGTVVMVNNSQVIYKNTIMTRNSSMFGLINRHSPVHIDFSCFYSQPDVKSLGIKLKHSSVFQQITSGEWSYNLTMKAYTSPDHMHAIQSSSDIQLDEKIWVELKTDGLDEKMVVVVIDSCWATDQPSPSGRLRYDLIIKGCPNPADQTVKVEGNGLGTSNYFSFNTFQFSGKTGDVYLHCRVELCVRQGNTCVPRCSQADRRRRSTVSKFEDENPAFISLAWTY